MYVIFFYLKIHGMLFFFHRNLNLQFFNIIRSSVVAIVVVDVFYTAETAARKLWHAYCEQK